MLRKGGSGGDTHGSSETAATFGFALMLAARGQIEWLCLALAVLAIAALGLLDD